LSSDVTKISFIIPVLNGEEYIARCIDSILSEICANEDEILVVDNGSTDGTIALLKKYKDVQILIRPGITVAGMRNAGAERASGDYYAFIDSDCTLETGWRYAVENTMRDQKIGATGSHYDIPDKSTWVEKAWTSNRKSKTSRVRWINTCNLIVRKSVFLKIGGFNSSLITDEDYDIGSRINTAGYIVLEEPLIRVIHYKNPKTPIDFLKRQQWTLKSNSRKELFTKIDKIVLMTVAFILFSLVSLSGIVLLLSGRITGILLVLGIAIVPAAAAFNRTLRFNNHKYYLHLLLLYFMYFIGRSISLLKVLVYGNSNRN
jgi:glycosyltransferase involved in cell wall biosynthesis